jgi:hypothetical protein
LIQNFALTVSGIHDESIAVTRTEGDEKTAQIFTEVSTSGASPSQIVWCLIKSDQGWRLDDLMENNVSAIAILQAQFAAVPDSDIDIRPLIRLLQEKSVGCASSSGC